MDSFLLTVKQNNIMNEIESKINSINRIVGLLLNFDDISSSGAKEIKERLNEMQSVVNKKLAIQNVMHRFPSNVEIWEWWKTQNFQKEDGEQEYTMIFEIDLPKILKAFTEHLLNGA